MTEEDNKLIKFEEQNCGKLQPKFLEKKGLTEAKFDSQIKYLESAEYWDFVEEKYNNGRNK